MIHKLTIVAVASMLLVCLTISPKVASAAEGSGSARYLVAGQPTHTGEGSVMWVKKRSGKIKLDHGPIKSIGWMAMKMVFGVKDKGILKGIKEGDKVSFVFYKAGEGDFVVTGIKHIK